MDELKQAVLGDRIKQRRLQLGLTQTELALASKYKDKSAIAKIEKGSITIPLERIIRIAAALRTSYAYLLGATDDPEDPEYAQWVNHEINTLERIIEEERQRKELTDSISIASNEHIQSVLKICTGSDAELSYEQLSDRIRIVTLFVEENTDYLRFKFTQSETIQEEQ